MKKLASRMKCVRILCFCSVIALWQITIGQMSAETQNGVFKPNMIIGTQAIGGPYQHTKKHYLLEVANEIEAMGSNIIKFALSPRNYSNAPYRMESTSGISSMTELLTEHPVMHELMQKEFQYYFIWAHPYNKENWTDGLSHEEETRVYNEFYILTRHLLTQYKDTGKVFFLGHWEGDWVLIGKKDPEVDPTPERIEGFAQYLQARQRAIDDAKAQYKHRDVYVFHYAEVNLVRKGIDGSRETLTNAVLPKIDVDFVSYSAYDSLFTKDPRESLHEALDHIESQLKPRPGISGKRVFVGEFAIKASVVDYDGEEHRKRNREIIHAIVEWGCPFALYWQFYCNEIAERKPQGYEGFWLVDNEGRRQPLYYDFKKYFERVRRFSISAEKKSGKLLTQAQIRSIALNYFSDRN